MRKSVRIMFALIVFTFSATFIVQAASNNNQNQTGQPVLPLPLAPDAFIQKVTELSQANQALIDQQISAQIAKFPYPINQSGGGGSKKSGSSSTSGSTNTGNNTSNINNTSGGNYTGGFNSGDNNKSGSNNNDSSNKNTNTTGDGWNIKY